MSVTWDEYGAAPERKGGETGDPRENPPTSVIVRHDSHLRKSGGNFAGNRIRSPGWVAMGFGTRETSKTGIVGLLKPRRASEVTVYSLEDCATLDAGVQRERSDEPANSDEWRREVSPVGWEYRYTRESDSRADLLKCMPLVSRSQECEMGVRIKPAHLRRPVRNSRHSEWLVSQTTSSLPHHCTERPRTEHTTISDRATATGVPHIGVGIGVTFRRAISETCPPYSTTKSQPATRAMAILMMLSHVCLERRRVVVRDFVAVGFFMDAIADTEVRFSFGTKITQNIFASYIPLIVHVLRDVTYATASNCGPQKIGEHVHLPRRVTSPASRPGKHSSMVLSWATASKKSTEVRSGYRGEHGTAPPFPIHLIPKVLHIRSNEALSAFDTAYHFETKETLCDRPSCSLATDDCMVDNSWGKCIEDCQCVRWCIESNVDTTVAVADITCGKTSSAKSCGRLIPILGDRDRRTLKRTAAKNRLGVEGRADALWEGLRTRSRGTRGNIRAGSPLTPHRQHTSPLLNTPPPPTRPPQEDALGRRAAPWRRLREEAPHALTDVFGIIDCVPQDAEGSGAVHAMPVGQPHSNGGERFLQYDCMAKINMAIQRVNHPSSCSQSYEPVQMGVDGDLLHQHNDVAY
ncbi:hypothetical protein PR048_025434 [Dryococelus australis]|uniref:Uncharacterized protein n=1 Tax=Dryococelus australis TaxID=614101 RepID=A0ABQ9GRD1_9NEOP|nr:hypothetical protein PR048_025434 [Dryococelus australis]